MAMPKAVLYIAAIMLLIALIPLPYGYYQLLRLVATVAFGWAAYISYHRQDQVLPWICGLLAMLFNPLVPIHLPRELWMPIDAAAGAFLLYKRNSFL